MSDYEIDVIVRLSRALNEACALIGERLNGCPCEELDYPHSAAAEGICRCDDCKHDRNFCWFRWFMREPMEALAGYAKVVEE